MIGNKVITKKGGHFSGFKEEVDKAIETDDEFLSWFDTSDNKQESFFSGEWDFSYHIFSKIAKYIHSPNDLKALEIGYGGGRLIYPASRHFSHVIGLDIHNQSEYVANLMREKHAHNIELLTLNSKSFPVADNSIDVVYSFIVFQHLESIEILERYISECARVLSKNGVCCIYFGRYTRFSEGRSSRSLCFLDRVLEFFLLRSGYLELDARVNEKNLVLSIRKINNILNKYGFRMIEKSISVKKIIGQEYKHGGQYGIVFRKN